MGRKINIISLLLAGILTTGAVLAQEEEFVLQEVNQDNLGNVTDAFQENFFEALKQKGIENYEKAILSLEECLKIEPENPVVYFELGKNYKLLKNYEAAVQNFQKSNRLQPNQEWVMAELLEAYSEKRDYEPAILVAKKLTSYNSKYYNNLADLYFKSQKFEELITLLDRLDSTLGVTEFRLGLRQQIYALTRNTSAQIQAIREAVKLNPENEANYLQLIFIYSEEGMEEEAFEAAKNMRTTFPNSTVVHLALYKFYLSSNNTEAALQSMKTVFKAEEIDAESKFEVLQDFLKFVNQNPQYENDLIEVVNLYTSMEDSPEVYQKLGEYFLVQNQKQKALDYFEKGIAGDLDNLELLTNTLLLQLDLSKFNEAASLSELGIEIFPAQPVLYLIRGVALNNQLDYKQAEEILTFGLDYVIENLAMTHDFYEELVIAYTGLGSTAKATEFKDKATQLKKTIN